MRLLRFAVVVYIMIIVIIFQPFVSILIDAIKFVRRLLQFFFVVFLKFYFQFDRVRRLSESSILKFEIKWHAI